jgi:hypothetical protein
MALIETKDMSEPQDLLALDEESLDENKHYRWVRATQKRLQSLVRRGYSLVGRSEDGVQPAVEAERDEKNVSVDDTIRDGDLILVQTDKENYENEVARRARFNEARLESVEDRFREKANQASRGLEKPVRTIGPDEED